ncbi:MAG: hypothetical protein WDK96_01660 [Candidatus Paceibacterota bacterium]|jgi:hypothetical protein
MDINWNRFLAGYKKYLSVFVITLSIFIGAFLLSNYVNGQKLKNLENIYQQIYTNVLSTETKFSLLRFASCQDAVSSVSFEDQLNQELNGMAKKVKYMEDQLGSDNSNVILIKTQYSLLQIKDYLLVRELATRCKKKISVFIYFHDLECTTDCSNQSLVLDEISSLYPSIRVYWFDRNLQTPAVQTLVSMFQIEKTPSLVINDKTYTGFKSISDIEKLIPDLVKARKLQEKAKLDAEKKQQKTTSVDTTQ